MRGLKLKGFYAIICLLILNFTVVSAIYAQTVIITSGTNDSTAQMLSTKTELLLHDIAEWSHNGVNDFPKDSGVDSLKALVKKEGLVPGLDTLRTKVVQYQNVYELPRIYMRSTKAEGFPYREVILSYTPKGKLVDARMEAPQENFDRIFVRREPASSADDSVMKSFLDSYAQTFNHKDTVALNHLFSDEAYIVTGLRSKTSGSFIFTRSDAASYLNKIADTLFVKGNRINVHFTNPTIYQHPDFPDIDGIIARQYWKTTDYSDVGYIYFIVKKNGSDNGPVLLARTWQKKSFEADYLPERYPVAVQQMDVTLSDTIAEDRGLILLSLKTPNADLVNPKMVTDWIHEGVLNFSGIKVDSDDVTTIDTSAIAIPFSNPSKVFTQQLKGTIHLRETSLLKGYSLTMPLYLSRINKLQLQVYNHGVVPPNTKFPDLTSNLSIRTNSDSVHISIETLGHHMIKNFIQPDTLSVIKLLEGHYHLDASKFGYEQEIKDVDIGQQLNAHIFVSMEKKHVVAKIFPKAEKESHRIPFYMKRKWWIIGGAAAAVIVGSAILLTGHASSGPGIPIPPGRPVIN